MSRLVMRRTTAYVAYAGFMAGALYVCGVFVAREATFSPTWWAWSAVTLALTVIAAVVPIVRDHRLADQATNAEVRLRVSMSDSLAPVCYQLAQVAATTDPDTRKLLIGRCQQAIVTLCAGLTHVPRTRATLYVVTHTHQAVRLQPKTFWGRSDNPATFDMNSTVGQAMVRLMNHGDPEKWLQSETAPDVDWVPREATNVVSAVAMPLRINDAGIGILLLDATSPMPYSPDDMALLSVARGLLQTALALHTNVAQTDIRLTGLDHITLPPDNSPQRNL